MGYKLISYNEKAILKQNIYTAKSRSVWKVRFAVQQIGILSAANIIFNDICISFLINFCATEPYCAISDRRSSIKDNYALGKNNN